MDPKKPSSPMELQARIRPHSWRMAVENRQLFRGPDSAAPQNKKSFPKPNWELIAEEELAGLNQPKGPVAKYHIEPQLRRWFPKILPII